MSGSTAGLATTVGTLTGRGALQAAIAGMATVAGTLIGRGALQAAISGIATVTGTLTAAGADTIIYVNGNPVSLPSGAFRMRF
jgi:hypothetical protein